MMAVGGFALYQVQQRLEQSNVLLSKGQENIRMLEERLKATGTDVSKTLQIMQGRLDSNESEIRKLWDVSNKRNKQWIQDNQSAIADLKGTDSKLSDRMSSVQGTLREAVNKFNELAAQMTTLRNKLVDENEEMSTQVSLLRSQVQDQSVKVEGNGRNLASLEKKVKDNDEAIKTIDEYRRHINQQLLELQSRVQSLGGGTASSP